MILSPRGKPYVNLDRVKRLEWLIENKDKYQLGNYPWGLPRAPRGHPDRHLAIKRLNKEDEIIKAMRNDSLFSENTLNRDININNLIVDAMNALRHGRYISST